MGHDDAYDNACLARCRDQSPWSSGGLAPWNTRIANIAVACGQDSRTIGAVAMDKFDRSVACACCSLSGVPLLAMGWCTAVGLASGCNRIN